MRILFLCHFFPPTHTAGAENYTFNLAQALTLRGHEVQVLCTGGWDAGEDYWNGYSDDTYFGIKVRRLNLCWHKAPDPNRYLYDNPIVAEFLQDWLHHIRPDIVHITSCYTLSARVIQVCKDANLPVMLTLVDFWFLCPSLHLLRSNGELCDGQTAPWDCLKCLLFKTKAYSWPAKIMPDRLIQPILTVVSQHRSLSSRRGLRGMALNMAERKRFLSKQIHLADLVIAPSEFLASAHSTVMGDLPVRVQPYGHNLMWLTDRLPLSSTDILRFSYLGQIAYDKGVHILIEAFALLGDNPSIALDIWGGLDSDTPYISRIQSLAAQSRDIRLRGRFPRSQLADVLAQASVVVVPSIWYENNPLVIQEAFAAKVPVIATNLGGMSEFVKHEVNGLLFQRGNVKDLAKQMQRIIDEPSLLEQLRAGIPPVKTIEQEVDELVAIYRQLQERRSRA